jgi:hypothetical protein
LAGPRALPAPARSVTAAVSESAGCSGGAWDCGYADLVQSEPGEKRATGGLMGYPTTIADRERFPLKRGHKDRVRGSGATGLPFFTGRAMPETGDVYCAGHGPSSRWSIIALAVATGAFSARESECDNLAKGQCSKVPGGCDRDERLSSCIPPGADGGGLPSPIARTGPASGTTSR